MNYVRTCCAAFSTPQSKNMSYFKITRIVFLISCMHGWVSGNNSQERTYDVQFTADFLHHLPSLQKKVLTHLCWKKDNLLHLSKKLPYTFVSHNLTKFQPNSIGVDHEITLLNLSCQGSVKHITQSLINNRFNANSIWIIFADLKVINSYNWYFPINSLVYVIERNKDSHFFVKIICKYDKEYLVYDEVDVAEWWPEQGFLYFNKFSIMGNRSDLKGTAIRVSYVLNHKDTLNHLWDYRDIYVDKLTKANYRLVVYVLELLNTSKVDVWTDNWGYRNKTTNVYNGMYGDLMLGRADLAATPGFIQAARLEHFKFIPPTSPARVLFIFQAPPLSYTSNVFMLPFNSLSLIIFFTIITLSSALIYASAFSEWKFGVVAGGNKPSISDVLVLECAALTQRSGSYEPKTNAGKIVLYFTFLLCLFVYVGFSGHIIVLLQSTSESITDPRSLYDSKMEIGVEDTPYNRYYFTNSSDQTNETYRRLFFENRVAPRNNWFTPRRGIERVKKGFFAFHVEIGSAYALIGETFTENEKCKVRESYTIFNKGDSFAAVPKNSAYTDIFLVNFRRILETGLQKREHLKYFYTKPQCIGRQGTYDSVGLVDCYFPFLILIYGLVISCLIVISEVVINKMNFSK